MKVSELLADLNTRAQDAQVVMVETDVDVEPDNILTIESIAGGNEKSVVLMGKSVTKKPFDLIFSSLVEDRARWRPTKTFKAEIHKSDKSDGKYDVCIGGKILQSNFGTVDEARVFLTGFVLGFETGSAGNGLNTSKDPPDGVDPTR